MLNTMEENRKKTSDFLLWIFRKTASSFFRTHPETDLNEDEILAVEDKIGDDLDISEDEVSDTDISYDGFTNDGIQCICVRLGKSRCLRQKKSISLAIR